ncbi:GNAT family N-acetyltransferase [Dongshaea marina]|uniref:GNAT family N-acetyltransferase n=1 Tax=Dongshaea marina TaxID=2047966 RepID=UPI000D3E02DD|nr:GNAT family N-acetyltransferase [Dongshaea marina]
MQEHDVGADWITKNFERRDFYLATDTDDNEVGFFSIQHFGKLSYLGYVYLDVKYVGRGFGHELLKFARSKALELGQQSMILLCHPKADWALKAYAKFGFRKILEQSDAITRYRDGILKEYYEEGFHLFEYPLSQ